MAEPIDYSQYTILYVDDEEQALKYFRKGFAGEFQVLTAPNVAAANTILDAQHENIAVVISDQRMPGLPGTALLARVRERWPTITRILVTAHAELQSAIDAVNTGAVFKYITKPVDWDDLQAKLKEAVDQHVALTHAANRGDVVRRQIVADRVRSLTHMASGINHHVRNSITALSCFLEEANPAETAGAAPPNTYLKNLWAAATEERDQLISRIDQIHRLLTPVGEQAVAETSVHALVRSALSQLTPSGAAVTLMGEDVGSSITIAAGSAAQALATLIQYAADHCTSGGRTRVSVLPAKQFHRANVVPIQINGDGPEWSEQALSAMFTPFDVPESDPSELGLAMTAAFSFIYNSGGDIVVHPAAPQGPGFEVLLPLKAASKAAA